MQPTDLNAHAAPWQGPRPTTGSGSAPATSAVASRTNGVAHEFVLHENVTNAHAAKTDGRAGASAAPAKSNTRPHLWWGGAQLSHQHVLPHVTARNGAAHWARPRQAPSSATFSVPAAAPVQAAGPLLSQQTASAAEVKPRLPVSKSSTVGSLIFDGRMHRNANPAASKPSAGALPTGTSGRSQSASSTASSSGTTAAREAPRGPLLGSESLLFDSTGIVQPSVTPAIIASIAGATLLSTPPVNGEDLAIILPSPMPVSADDDSNHTSRVVYDVADLLGGISRNAPSQAEVA